MPGLSTPFLVSIYFWFAWEVGLLVRDLVQRKGRLGLDHGTRVIVSLTLTGSILIGIVLRSWVPALDTPAPNAFAVAGAVVIWVGLALRVWAVLTLGRSSAPSSRSTPTRPSSPTARTGGCATPPIPACC